MDSKFVITTTGNIEFGTIVRYIDVVCANIVIGANVFSDFMASFTDFFGGNSKIYQNKMDNMYNEVMIEIKNKAKNIGANAIIGLKIDFDEISGKDKSMFMISASGTACVAMYEDKYINNEENNKQKAISKEKLAMEILRRSAIRTIQENRYIPQEFIDYLSENPQDEIFETLFHMFMDSIDSNMESEVYKRHTSLRVLSNYSDQKLIDYVYNVYLKNHDISKNLVDLINKCHLFDAIGIYEIMKKDLHVGISLLQSDKNYYTKDDVAAMDVIKSFIDTLPDKGKIEVVKGGVFSKEQEKYICPLGHKNNVELAESGCPTCKLNIKGLTLDEVNVIHEFKNKIDALRNLIDK